MRRFLPILMLPALGLAIHDMKWFDLNRWRCPFYNDGRWGVDTTPGQATAGGFWRDTAYIFGAGIWFGAVLDSDTLVTTGYIPNNGGTEFAPALNRYWREGYNNPDDRIYVYPGDWPPPPGRFPMAPTRHASDLDLWGCYGDSDATRHQSPGRPIGVDVAFAVGGFTGPLAEDVFFIRYDCHNFSDFAITGGYAGLVMDADVGEVYDDDLVGLIRDRWFALGPDSFRVRDVGFTYSQDHVPSGVVAVKLLSEPSGPGMSAFKYFAPGYDPVTDPDRYMTMAGYDYRTGEYLPFDSVDLSPADKRMILCTGPFDLQPDSSATIWYAVIGAPFWNGPGPASDTNGLARRCLAAELLLEVLTGVADQSPAVLNAQPATTIVRGVLRLGAGTVPQSGASDALGLSRAALLDISGRKVMDLHAGENDVSGLGPGVYFVNARGGRDQAEEGPSVHKVLVTR